MADVHACGHASAQSQQLTFNARMLKLHFACRNGNVTIVRELIESHAAHQSASGRHLSAFVNARNVFDTTALMIAATRGDKALVQLLLDAGATVDASPSDTTTTVLRCAFQEGHLEVVDMLLERITATTTVGVSVASRIGVSLAEAAKRGHNDIVRILLASGADANDTIRTEQTALYYATERGDLELVQLLVASGADINLMPHAELAPLHTAASAGHLEVVRFLADHGANINLICQGVSTPLTMAAAHGHVDVVRFLLDRGAGVDTCNGSWTPLHNASLGGHCDVVRVLLEHSADVDRLTRSDYTALYIAARKNHIEVVELLIANGANVDKASQGIEAPPLYVASKHCRLDMMRLLLRNGASVDKAIRSNKTPLYVAATEGHYDAALLLLEHGAAVDQANDEYWTPLLAASENGHADIVMLLLAHGADIYAKRLSGDMPLTIASSSGCVAVVRALLCEGGADVDYVYDIGPTALHEACRMGHAPVVVELLKHHADLSKHECDGTVLHAAAQHRCGAVVQVLLRDANVRMLIDAVDSSGNTALALAQRAGSFVAKQALLDAGAWSEESVVDAA